MGRDLKGALQADFSSFTDAVNSAVIKLKEFEGDSAKVGAALTRMGDSFSGVKIQQQASLMAEVFTRAGGAATFTTNELQRMGAVGNEALEKLQKNGQPIPATLQAMVDGTKNVTKSTIDWKGALVDIAGAFGIAFSVGTLVNFGRGLVDNAGKLVDLNTKTGASIEQLQRWQFVGAQSKVSVDDFAASAFKLGVNLAGNAKGSVRQAVIDLGLSYETLKAQSPDAQFNATIAALEGMIDPQERNRVGVELFGKAWSTIAPAVSAGYSDMAKAATVSSDQQVKAINDASAAWDRWVTNSKAGLTSVLGSLIIADEEFKKLTLSEKAHIAISGLLSGSMTDLAVQVGLLNIASASRAKQVDINLPKEKAARDAATEYAKEAREAALALKELTTAQSAGIASALQLGKSHDEIAVAFHISDAALALYIDRQRKAVTTANELEAAEKKRLETEAAALLATTKLQDEYNAMRVSHGGTANDIAIAQIDRWAADLKAQMIKAGTATASFYNALATLSKEKMEAARIDWSLWSTRSIQALQETAEKERATYDAMVSSGAFFRGELDKQKEKWEAARDAARGYGTTVVGALDEATDAARRLNDELDKQRKKEEDLKKQAAEIRAMGGSVEFDLSTQEGRRKVPADIAAWLHDGYSLEQASRIAYAMKMGFDVSRDPLFSTKGPRVPGFAEGVKNFSGGMAVVGEKGPELVNLPRGSNVLPNLPNLNPVRGGGGLVMHNNITINGSVLGNQHEIATVVGEAITARMRALGYKVRPT